jgi:hypothetical protein
MGVKTNAYNVLVEKSEGKIPLGRPRCTRVNVTMEDLKQIG